MITVCDFLKSSEHNPGLYLSRKKAADFVGTKRVAMYINIASDRALVWINDPQKRPPKAPLKGAYNLYVQSGKSYKINYDSGYLLHNLINYRDSHGHHAIIMYDGCLIWE